jgi:asparagine synthase (glutamine-hydrolysing)
MAAHYLAYARDRRADAAALAERWSEVLASGWIRALRRPGIDVWTHAAQPLPVTWSDRDGAIILGRYIPNRGQGNCTGTVPGHSVSMTAAARRLVEAGSGAYVAIWRDPATDRAWVLRDPSGALDVLTWRRAGLHVIASDLESLPPGLGPSQVSLDWDALADFVRRPVGISARSALCGVETVAAGDLQPLGATRAEAVPLWRPAAFARQASPQGSAIEAQLREAVGDSVETLVTPHPRCIVEVSGGLDSAVVATTVEHLGLAPQVAATLHLFGDRLEGDERRWAGLVCDRLSRPGVARPLAVRSLGPDDFSELARGARPAINALDVDRDRQTAEVAISAAATAIVTGKGGDALFFQHPTAWILSDYIAAQAWGGAIGVVARDTARRLRRSVWSVAAEAVGALRRPQTLESTQPWWGPRTREPPVGSAHPWLEDLADLPPGKRFQIEAIAQTQLHRGVTRYGRLVDVVHPLMAQPVLELCLRIPVWELARGGRDRALARAAFADRVPEAVIRRRSKGELTSFYTRTVAASLPFLRDHLLDGCLAGAEVVDRDALSDALDPDALIRSADAADILTAVAIESWVRHWQGLVPDSPRADRLWR